jgi:SAM-dependent methyltransferase
MDRKMYCRICKNNKNNKFYTIKEMMFGYNDKFEYFECTKCMCLQISEIPQNITKYYPQDYYSYSSSSPIYRNPIKNIMRIKRNDFTIFNKGIVGRILYNLFPDTEFGSLSKINLNKNSKILDVGCGAGSLLYYLKERGFEYTMGIDPFIKEDIEYKNGLIIRKRMIQTLDDKWDLIMFNHSFEHMDNPLETMQFVSKLLTQKGVCLVRIPTVTSYAWHHYGINWVQLDAPRHFFLHSVQSMELLAEKSNLILNDIIYDSTEFQFWGSEQYMQNIFHKSSNSYGAYPSNSIFSKSDIRNFRRKAKKLNSEQKGDQAAFYFKKMNCDNE